MEYYAEIEFEANFDDYIAVVPYKKTLVYLVRFVNFQN